VKLFLFLILLITISGCATTIEYIPPYAQYADAECMNYRFEKLYEKFGKGKKVPNIFNQNSAINWSKIYENFDCLLRKGE